MSFIKRCSSPIMVSFAARISATFLAVLLIFLISSDSPLAYVRWIFGIIFLLFVPGNALTGLLSVGEDKKFSILEQIALSIGLSLMVLSLSLSLLNFFWEISLISVLASTGLTTLFLSIVVVYLNLKMGKERSLASSPPQAVSSRFTAFRKNILKVIFLCGVTAALFSFVISPLVSSSVANYFWMFAMNNSILDLFLLLFGALISLFFLRTKKRVPNFSAMCWLPFP